MRIFKKKRAKRFENSRISGKIRPKSRGKTRFSDTFCHFFGGLWMELTPPRVAEGGEGTVSRKNVKKHQKSLELLKIRLTSQEDKMVVKNVNKQ